MDHPLIWQSILLIACIVAAFTSLIALIASARTGYHIGRIVIRDAAQRRRMRNA
jgi:uncharacterized membrane protein YdjX (TVP38/TMEM64 family)